MSMRPASRGAVRLMHEGVLAFAAMESNGMRIDVDYLRKTKIEVVARIGRITEKLKSMDTYAEQRKLFGSGTKVTANPQLAKVLYDIEGHECHSFTDKGAAQLDETALERIGTKYTKGFLKLSKLHKVLGTYLAGLEREVSSDGFIHPSFSLHTTKTYRSSCREPNSQNFPKREEESAKAVRSAIIPRDGHALLEVDVSGAEVMVSACYHHDPNMLDQIKNKYDLHSAVASEVYLLPKGAIPRAVRQQAKSSYTFPSFYGSWWKQMASELWDNAIRYRLETADGTPMLDHLKQKGITELGACGPKEEPRQGTYEAHVKGVERMFWGEWFPIYAKWKKDWYASYLKTGGFRMKTGFVVEGVYSRNDATNYAVQGAAFHALLYVIIRMTKWLRDKHMRSRICGQIHDSLIVDAHLNEVHEVGAKIKELFAEELPRVWKWLIVPLEVEADISTANWFLKEEFLL